MLNSLTDRRLLRIILLCFLAPIVYANFFLGETLIIYKVIGFVPDKVKYYGIVGCPPENWMYAAISFSSIAIHLVILIAAFLLSKQASRNNRTNLLLFSAFLFYPAGTRIVFKAINFITGNPFSFIEHKISLEENHIGLFGSMYNYNWAQFIIGNLVTIVALIAAYQIIFKHWDKKLRIQFFTFGAVACLLGNLAWYYFLGPMIY